MSFPIIGTQSVWSNWGGLGFGSWQMWFMAPYGSWIYAGYVKSNTPVFKKIDIGSVDPDYEMIDWDFGLTSDTPADKFPYEQHEGYPDGAMGMGVIREDDGASDTFLYLMGRIAPAPNANTVLRRFSINDNFEEFGSTMQLTYDAVPTNYVQVNQVCGIEVMPGSDPEHGIFLVTNNRGGEEFELRKYAESWDGGVHGPTITKDLSPYYIENNTLGRIRGIGHASDGNILVFINSGLSSTATKILKFNAETLAFMGQTTWEPSLASSIWGYITQSSEVYMLFRGLDTNNSLDWKTAIYYDRATAIPDATKSNFIVENNLVAFASDDPVELKYIARDAFNIPVVATSCKFVIDGEDETDSSTWTDRVGAIRENPGDDFFNPDGTPKGISAVPNTDGDGIALAYYKPMRIGSGTDTDAINIECPSS